MRDQPPRLLLPINQLRQLPQIRAITMQTLPRTLGAAVQWSKTHLSKIRHLVLRNRPQVQQIPARQLKAHLRKYRHRLSRNRKQVQDMPAPMNSTARLLFGHAHLSRAHVFLSKGKGTLTHRRSPLHIMTPRLPAMCLREGLSVLDPLSRLTSQLAKTCPQRGPPAEIVKPPYRLLEVRQALCPAFTLRER